MSKIVDEKVVQMEFDNKNFEKNVSKTMSTLDKLKQALKFDGASKGITELEQRSSLIKFNGLSDTINKLADKFSGLQMAGTLALYKIANSAADAGLRIAKSLSVDNITAGWSKLQQKANSMSTLISQGYETSVVEEQLEKLNWFSDETSYNFTDMIDNIAKFTATGQDLEGSVTAMQGIALWAAKSGQNAQKASAAMYQLSQALGSGIMRKEDWKSIQNASMDTAEFRQQAIDTAIAMGTLKKVGEDTYKSLNGNKQTFTKSQFADSLTEGQWFTSDVMMEVYKKYAKASDQMKKAIDIMDSDYNLTISAGQMIKGYDALKNGTFDDFLKDAEIDDEAAAESLRKMISEFDEFGISTFRAGQEYRTFNDAIDATKDAVSTKWMGIFETLIGNIDAQKALWTSFGEKFYEWFAAPLDELQDLLNRWVDMGGRESLWAGLSNIGKAINAIIKPIKEAFIEIFPKTTAEQLVKFTKGFENFTKKLIISGENADKIKNIFKGLFSVLKTGIDIGLKITKTIISILSNFKPLITGILTVVGAIGKWIDKSAEVIRKSGFITKALNTIADTVKLVTEKVGTFLKETLKFDKITNFLKTIFGLIVKVGSAITKTLGSVISNGSLKDVADLVNTGLLGGLIVGITKLIKSFKSITDNLKDFSKNATTILSKVKDILQAYQKDIQAKTLIKIATAVALLAGSLLILSMIDEKRLGSALLGLTMALTELMIGFKIFSKLTNDVKIGLKNTVALIGLSISMSILAGALKKLGDMSWGEITRGLSAMAGVFTILLGAMAIITKAKLDSKALPKLFGMSLSMVILAGALKILATMSWGDIGRSLTAMAGTLAIYIGALWAVSAIGDKIGTSSLKSLLKMAVSLTILAGALKILATMSWDDIWRSMATMGMAMGAYILAIIAVNVSSGKLKTNGLKGLLGMAVSMVILAGALKILATMTWDDIWRSMTAMGITLAAFVAALMILGSNKLGSLVGAGALLIAANSLVIFALALKVLSTIPWKKAAKALITIAGAFLVIGAAAVVLKPLVGTILKLSAALALFGIGTAAIGAGLLLISAGIAALAAALGGGVTVIIAGITAIIKGIWDLIPELLKTAKNIILELCRIIIQCAPAIAEAAVVTIYEVLKLLADYIGPIVNAIADILINTIDALAVRMPDIIVSAVKLLQSFFKGFADAFDQLDPKTMLSGIKAISLLSVALLAMAALAVTAPLAMVGIIAFGALVTELALVVAAIGQLAKIDGINELVAQGGGLLLNLGTAIGNFIGGLIGGIGNGLSSSLPEIASNLSAFMTNLQPFIQGVNTINPDMIIKIGALSGAIILLTAADLIASIANILSLGSSLPELGKDLGLFMIGIQPFILGAASIKSNIIKNISYLSAAILEITAANLLDSISSWLTGSNSLSQFGTEIAKLGIGLSNFVTNLGTFNEAQVTTIDCASRAIASLGHAASEIPNEGGLWAKIAGDNSLATFSGYLPGLATDMAAFVNNLGTFNSEQVTTVSCAADAIAKLAEGAKQIPNEGGLWGWLAGDNSLGKFSGYLPDLGTNLSSFGANLGTFSNAEATTVECASNAIAALAKASKDIPNSGGVWGWLAGDNDLGDFAENLPNVAAGIKGFVDKLGNFGQGKVDSVNAASSLLKEIAALGKLDLPIVATNLSTLGSKLSGFGDNVKSFVDKLGTVTTESINTAVGNLKTLANSTINILSTEEMSTKITNLGKTFAQGFANGIENNKYLATNAGTNLGNAAYNAAKKAIDSHSPSKKAHKLGNFFGLGFVNGIQEYESTAYSESYDMADQAKKGLTKAVSSINKLLDNGTTNEPVIKPILDLSDIQKGASSIGGMFTDPNVGANLNAISYGMKVRSQNGVNDEVVSAINKLGASVGKGGDTYNINGVTYDDESGISDAVRTLIRAANIERRV